MEFFHYLWSFVVVLSTVVFVHEFGHYLVARLCGVRIEAFSIGFGRELFGWNDKHGTRWKVSALPLGGYVKMKGDASAASNADFEALDALSASERAETFYGKKLWQKAAIVAAGPVANFILTIGILTYFIASVGLSSTEPVVGGVLEDTPAQAAGLQAGDRVERIDGKSVRRFADIPMLILTNTGKPVSIDLLRGEEHFTVTLTPAIREEEDALGNKVARPLIGIRSQDVKMEEVGVPAAMWEATRRTWQMGEATLRVIGQIVTGERSAQELKGPVGIAQLSGQATAKDVSTTLWLIALLSANLGLMNLLPVPMLDGGHLLFYTAEALRGRPLARKVQEWGYRVGFAMVIMLMAFTIFNDLRQLVF